MSKVLIFDCDGVLGDTEQDGHLPAFNQMWREFGVPWQWSVEEYGEKLKIGVLKGRYLNGEAELKASLSDGNLVVTLETLEVNGKRPPERFLSELRKQNLAKDAYENPKNVEMIRRFESLEIKDGKIILKPRIHAKTPSGADGPQAPASLPSPSRPKLPQAEAPEREAQTPKAK
ncbi:MAG: hypothetical protein ABSE84_10580 [Isosphaeraceae bacterium]